MKEVLTIICSSVLVWGCAQKMTPAKSETPVSNAGVAATPNTNNQSSPTAAPVDYSSQNAQTGGVSGTKDLSKVPARSPQDETIMAGMSTFNAKCGRCHGLKVTTNYTEIRWLEIMQVMAMKANLSETEKANVLAYVRANAKK